MYPPGEMMTRSPAGALKFHWKPRVGSEVSPKDPGKEREAVR